MNEMVSCSECMRKDELPSSFVGDGAGKSGSQAVLGWVAGVVASVSDAKLSKRVRPSSGENEGIRPRMGDETGVGACCRIGLKPNDEATEGKRRRAMMGFETTRMVPMPRASRVDRARSTTALAVSLPDESTPAGDCERVEDGCVGTEPESDDQSSSSRAGWLTRRSLPRRSRRRRAIDEGIILAENDCRACRRPEARAGGREMGGR